VNTLFPYIEKTLSEESLVTESNDMNEAKLKAEVAVLTEMVRVLSDRIAQMDTKQEQGEPNIQSYLEKDNSQPVAWMDIDEKGAASGLRYWSEPDNRHEVALYTK
jgi:hypothetical protein